MPITLPRYRVLVANLETPEDLDAATEHDVTILHGDQLRAELEAPRNALPGMDVAPIHGLTLWIWAALMRTGAIDEPFQVFLPRMLGFEDLGEDSGALPGDPATPADPTQPAAPSGSPSPSPSTGQELSTAGSTVTDLTPTG